MPAFNVVEKLYLHSTVVLLKPYDPLGRCRRRRNLHSTVVLLKLAG